MLRGLITHPPHAKMRDMPTPPILSNDAGSNKMLNMLRCMLTYPTQIPESIIYMIMFCLM
eukprot:10008766-Ditylum_brightwellii.AAC.1